MFGGMEMSHLYLSGLRAWEVEELACVKDWMYRVYASVVKEGKGLVHEADMEVERDELRCFMTHWKRFRELSSENTFLIFLQERPREPSGTFPSLMSPLYHLFHNLPLNIIFTPPPTIPQSSPPLDWIKRRPHL
jgi:hypothetical protein